MHKTCVAALAALPFVTGAVARGADHKWYVGLDVGQSRLENGNFAGDTMVDDTSSAYAVRFGYRFVPWFALEGGYTDIGDFSATIVPACGGFGVPCAPNIYNTTSIHGFLLNAVGIWPLAEHFQLNASLGAIYRELTQSSGTSPGGNSHWSSKDTVARFGLGVAVPFNDHFEIGLDLVQYRNIGLALDMGSNTTVVNDGESTVASLGLRWRF
jgi:OOP family OmpA-OmpF porin